MHEVEHLAKMANQIADNFAFHDDAEERLRDHLQRFWAPSMRNALRAFCESGGEGLHPLVVSVLGKAEQA